MKEIRLEAIVNGQTVVKIVGTTYDDDVLNGDIKWKSEESCFTNEGKAGETIGAQIEGLNMYILGRYGANSDTDYDIKISARHKK